MTPVQISDYDPNYDQIDPKVKEEALAETYLRFGSNTFDEELCLTDNAQEYFDEVVSELNEEVL